LQADSNNKKQTVVQQKPFRGQKLKKNAKIMQKKSLTNESRAGITEMKIKNGSYKIKKRVV
jgi:hypothetical protein